MKRIFTLAHDVARRNAMDCVRSAPPGWVVEVREPRRSLDQNACLWPVLTDIAEQVEWCGKKRSPEDWKDLLTAAFRQCEIVPGVDGRFVVLGLRTSQMTKREFSDFLEFVLAFGSEREVVWTHKEPAHV